MNIKYFWLKCQLFHNRPINFSFSRILLIKKKKKIKILSFLAVGPKVFSSLYFFRRDFSLKLVVVDLLIPILPCTKAHLSNILRFSIKNYCWHFLSQKSFRRSMWRILQYNLFFSIYFDHSIVFKSNPERLRISFKIPFVT